MSQPLSGALGRKIGLETEHGHSHDGREYEVRPRVLRFAREEREDGATPVRDMVALVFLILGFLGAVVGVGLVFGWPEALMTGGVILFAVGVLVALG